MENDEQLELLAEAINDMAGETDVIVSPEAKASAEAEEEKKLVEKFLGVPPVVENDKEIVGSPEGQYKELAPSSLKNLEGGAGSTDLEIELIPRILSDENSTALDVIISKRATKNIDAGRRLVNIKMAERAIGMRIWRIANGLSYADVAHMASTTPMAIYRWESKAMQIQKAQLEKLEKVGYPKHILYMGQK